MLGHYVRERRILPLEEAVRKMTSLPAAKLGLRDRGLLRPGAFADVVVFDRETVAHTATFADPHRYPSGIPWVPVNGQPVIAEGRHTGARPGRVVTRRARGAPAGPSPRFVSPARAPTPVHRSGG